MTLVELDFEEQIRTRIKQLNQDYQDTDSQFLQHKFLSQIEELELTVLPLTKKFHYNLNIMTNCLHKKDKYIEQLQEEIRSLKGNDN